MRRFFYRRGRFALFEMDLGAEEIERQTGGVLVTQVIPALQAHLYSVASWMVRIEPTPANGLVKTSAADCFQIRSVSTNRLVRKIGQVAAEGMEQIVEGIRVVVEA